MKRVWIALAGLLAFGAAAMSLLGDDTRGALGDQRCRPCRLDQTFASGETLDYSLSWLKIPGGAARMTIGPHQPGELRLTSIGKSSASFGHIFKVHDEFVSVVDAGDFSTHRFEKHLEERGRVKDETTIVSEPMGIAVRRRAGKNPQAVHVTPPVLDPLSLVYRLRTLNLTPGAVHHLPMLADGKLFAVEATVVGRETIETPAGRFACVIVEPKMTTSGLFHNDATARLRIWYSEDERRLPVRIRSDVKFGAITANLQAVYAGAGTPEPPAAARN